MLCNFVNEGKVKKVKEILNSIDDMSVIMDYDKRTPLHLAAVNNRIEIAHLLIKKGAKVNCMDRWGVTPL